MTWRPEEGIWLPWARVTGGCESPNMGAGIWTMILCESSGLLNCWTISLDLLFASVLVLQFMCAHRSCLSVWDLLTSESLSSFLTLSTSSARQLLCMCRDCSPPARPLCCLLPAPFLVWIDTVVGFIPILIHIPTLLPTNWVLGPCLIWSLSIKMAVE